MTVQRAAHVKMPVSHGSHMATNLLTVGGAIGGGIAGASAGGIGAIPGASAGSSIGGSAGKVIDKVVVGDSIRGFIVDGVQSVLVGEDRERAANADPAKKEAGCDNAPIAEGSESVFAERWNFSRKDDRTECGGKVADGCPTVHIGGRPSRKGAYIRDKGTTLDTIIDVGGQTLGVMSAKGLVDKSLGRAGIVSTLTGSEDLGDGLNVFKGGRALRNGSTLDRIDSLGSMGNSGAGFKERWGGSD